MPVYKTISNQSIYDVSIEAAGDLSNLFNVISQTGTINGFVPFGENVSYDVPTVTRRLIQKIPINNPQNTVYLTGNDQTIFDVAVQLLGDVARIDEILGIIATLGTKIAFSVPIPYAPTFDPVAIFFSNKMISTAIQTTPVTITDSRLLETGDFRLTETGDFRLLE